MHFFHKESPADSALLEDPEYFGITRDFLDFCFDNPNQIAREVKAWGSDWSAALAAVEGVDPVGFVHGAEHAFHRIKTLRRLVATHPDLALTELLGLGQLGLIMAPEEVARTVVPLFSPSA